MDMKYFFKKRYLKSVLLILSCICALSSCDNYELDVPISPFFSVDKQSLNFEQEGANYTLEVRCNEEYSVKTVDGLENWCSISRMENGNLDLTISANEEKNVRKGQFYIITKSYADTISIAQLGWGKAILLSQSNFNVEESGSKFSVEVTANVAYIFDTSDCDWIHESVATRNAHESVTTRHNFIVNANKEEKRIGSIKVRDIDNESSIEPITMSIIQKGLESYVPDAPKNGEDLKLTPSGATGDGGVPGGNYDAMFDNNMSTEWQARWKSEQGGVLYPQYVEFTFNEKADLDYIVYLCNSSANRAKDVKVEVMTDVNANRSSEYVMVYEGTLPNSASARIDFKASQSNVSKVKITMKTCYDMSKPLRCNEMEFYQKDPSTFDYTTLFSDPACTELKAGITETDIINCTNSFYKNMAWYMYNNKYPHEFRIADYKAYPHPDVQAGENKTGTYSILDNPTGIFVAEGENLAVMADLKGMESVVIRIQDLDTPGKDGFDAGVATYTLRNGINTLQMKRKGLIYVMYHTKSYQTAPAITLHFASGKVNGFFDSQNPAHEGRWSELLSAAVDKHFDVLGKYVHLTFPTLHFMNQTKDGKALIDLYDELVYREQEFLGLEKYNRMFKNRSYFNVMYNDSYMYSSSYRTSYVESSLIPLTNETQLKANCWGPAHEVGHTNQTRPGLKWTGMTEVSNNITAQYIQTSIYNEPSRLQSQAVDGFPSRYGKAWTNIISRKKVHALEEDVFCKLVPFWQLELYFGKALGQTPMKQQDHGGFYPDVYQYVRVNKNPATDGACQLEFVYNCCVAAKTDLTDFFEKWGFLSVVDAEIDDYGKKRIKIEEKEITALRARIVALEYAKPKVALEYITDNTIELFKNTSSVTSGTALRENKTFTMNNWKNVVAFEVKDNQGNLIYVSEGAEPSSNTRTFTLTSDWKSGYTVNAVSATGEHTAVSVQ